MIRNFLVSRFLSSHFVVLFVGIFVGGLFVFFLMREDFGEADYLSFNFADKNKDGFVNKNEFRKILLQHSRVNNRKLVSTASSFNITSLPNTATVPFDSADQNNDGTIDLNEFKQTLLAIYQRNHNQHNQRNQHSQHSRPIITGLEPKGGLLSEHADCLIDDMPADVRCTSDFTWQGGRKTAIFKSPTALAVLRDGTAVFVVLRDVNAVGVLDTLQNKFVRYISVGKTPNGITISPDEKYLYITSGEYNGRVQIIEIVSGKILRESAAGHTPIDAVITPDGQRLFVCNRFSNDVCEFETSTLTLLRRIKVIREPMSMAITPDGKTIFVANNQPDDLNNYPERPDKRPDVAALISVIDTTDASTTTLRLPTGSCNVNGICVAQNGEYVYLTHLVSHYWNDTDKLDFGQMNINALSVIELNKVMSSGVYAVRTFTLDDAELGAANPYAVIVSGGRIFVTAAGTDELLVISAGGLHEKLRGIDKTDFSGDFKFLDGMKTRIKLSGKGARSIVAAGRSVFVGLYFSDMVQHIDFGDVDVVSLAAIPIGQLAELSQARAGEMYWNDAMLCYQQWQSCASCHPDARMTAMSWDLLHDGAGNPKNTKSLILSHQTPPTMWLGDRRHAMQCTRTGFRFIMFSMPQSEPCFAIDEYTRTLKPVKSPYLNGGKLTAKAERGKILFNDLAVGCAACHSGQYFTDLKMYDVGSEDQFCDQKLFDTPTLIEVWRTAPYMHDGRYKTIKDILKLGKHGKENGNIEQLSDSQLDDITEYILSL